MVTADESALHGRQSHRLVPANQLGLQVAGRERNKHGGHESDDGPRAQIHSRLHRMEAAQGVECAYGGYHKRARYEGCHLIVGELDPGPGIEQVGAEAVNTQRAIRFKEIAHGMLHEGVCHQNEVAGEPASQRDRQRSQEVIARTQSLFAPDERTDKGGFRERTRTCPPSPTSAR